MALRNLSFEADNVGVFRQLLQQATTDGGLAGANLSGKKNKSTLVTNPVHEVRQRFTMLLTFSARARLVPALIVPA